MKVLERLARFIVTGDPTAIDGNSLEVKEADILASFLILKPLDGYKFVRFAMNQGNRNGALCPHGKGRRHSAPACVLPKEDTVHP